jgi:hypothetical protein
LNSLLLEDAIIFNAHVGLETKKAGIISGLSRIQFHNVAIIDGAEAEVNLQIKEEAVWHH